MTPIPRKRLQAIYDYLRDRRAGQRHAIVPSQERDHSKYMPHQGAKECARRVSRDPGTP